MILELELEREREREMRWRKVDIRQVLAAMLTLSMFGMLANMIKRDHFDYVEVNYPAKATIQYHAIKIAEKNLINHHRTPSGIIKQRLWIEMEKRRVVKLCWNFCSPIINQQSQTSRGHITFSLTDGPEYHVSQVANAVLVAKYVGAKLLLPDIKGSKPEARRNFSDIYDHQKFYDSLKGVIQVTQSQHIKTSPVVQVPNMVSEDHIEARIKPIFKQKGSLHLSTYFPSTNTRANVIEAAKDWDPTTCLAMFGTLQLRPQVQEIVDDMVRRLRTLGEDLRGNFVVAIDLRDEILHGKSCPQVGVGDNEIDLCSAAEIGNFLVKIGFGLETAVYVTQSRWRENLDPLRDMFPRTYTKELLMPTDKKGMFLNKVSDELLEKVLDLYICSQSDVYIPTIPDLFSTNVVGKRIASGRSWILVPAKIPSSSSTSAINYVAPYVSKKNHLAYSCLC